MITVWQNTDCLELSRAIESLRARLNRLGNQHGFADPKVLNCSEQLDELLIRYYQYESSFKP